MIRFTSVQDAGKAIHPSYVEGQMQGGSAQGIGWALNRRILRQRGRRDDEFEPARLPKMPTSLDLPTNRDRDEWERRIRVIRTVSEAWERQISFRLPPLSLMRFITRSELD